VSQEAQNVEAVRQGFHALRVGGVEALLRFFTTDVVMHPFPERPDDPVYHGTTALASSYRDAPAAPHTALR
jgi:ketosteroid isomerase-like protein